MEVRYCLEMKNPKRFFAIDLYNQISKYKANMIDLGDKVYITGVAPYYSFSLILERCLTFGVVECEIGKERSEYKAPE